MVLFQGSYCVSTSEQDCECVLGETLCSGETVGVSVYGQGDL